MDADWASPEHMDRVIDELRHRLPPKRYLHTLGVAHTALALAVRHGVNPTTALAAGLLHDVAKKRDLEPYRKQIKKDPGDRDFPGIWHAIAGAHVAEEEFGVRDAEVLRAIRIHPTGDADMSDLERVLFLSDYTEPQRNYDGVRELAVMARSDLGAAMDAAIQRKSAHILRSGKPLHKRSRHALVEAEKRHPEPQPAEIEENLD